LAKGAFFITFYNVHELQYNVKSTKTQHGVAKHNKKKKNKKKE